MPSLYYPYHHAPEPINLADPTLALAQRLSERLHTTPPETIRRSLLLLTFLLDAQE